ncbi:MAG TPA: carboxypeptidase-like regulatory domain-containing protein, partial [Thermoanaerobaculia bacterium]
MKGCRYRVLAALLLVGGATAFAQTTGEALGNVTDSSGGALPGVTVEAFGAALQGTRNVTTGRDGSYRLPALAPGIYRIRASLSGFRPEEKSAVVTL